MKIQIALLLIVLGAALIGVKHCTVIGASLGLIGLFLGRKTFFV